MTVYIAERIYWNKGDQMEFFGVFDSAEKALAVIKEHMSSTTYESIIPQINPNLDPYSEDGRAALMTFLNTLTIHSISNFTIDKYYSDRAFYYNINPQEVK